MLFFFSCLLNLVEREHRHAEVVKVAVAEGGDVAPLARRAQRAARVGTREQLGEHHGEGRGGGVGEGWMLVRERVRIEVHVRVRLLRLREAVVLVGESRVGAFGELAHEELHTQRGRQAHARVGETWR